VADRENMLKLPCIGALFKIGGGFKTRIVIEEPLDEF
jgi:hypothetical protein